MTTASSGFWPRVDLFVNYSRSDDESPYKFGAQTSDNTSFGYQVNWNVFDRLQTLTGRGHRPRPTPASPSTSWSRRA